jgi:hypothetical protein
MTSERHARHGSGRGRGSRPSQALPRVDPDMHYHCGVLFQTEGWWDTNGRGHRLTSMSNGYLLNVEAHLREQSVELADLDRSRERCGHCRDLLEGITAPDVDEAFDAQAWVIATPLARALVQEIKTRGLTPREQFS